MRIRVYHKGPHLEEPVAYLIRVFMASVLLRVPRDGRALLKDRTACCAVRALHLVLTPSVDPLLEKINQPKPSLAAFRSHHQEIRVLLRFEAGLAGVRARVEGWGWVGVRTGVWV